jgi:hypothetical protein
MCLLTLCWREAPSTSMARGESGVCVGGGGLRGGGSRGRQPITSVFQELQ